MKFGQLVVFIGTFKKHKTKSKKLQNSSFGELCSLVARFRRTLYIQERTNERSLFKTCGCLQGIVGIFWARSWMESWRVRRRWKDNNTKGTKRRLTSNKSQTVKIKNILPSTPDDLQEHTQWILTPFMSKSWLNRLQEWSKPHLHTRVHRSSRRRGSEWCVGRGRDQRLTCPKQKENAKRKRHELSNAHLHKQAKGFWGHARGGGKPPSKNARNTTIAKITYPSCQQCLSCQEKKPSMPVQTVCMLMRSQVLWGFGHFQGLGEFEAFWT